MKTIIIVLSTALMLSGCATNGELGFEHHPIDCATGFIHSDCLPGTLGYERGVGTGMIDPRPVPDPAGPVINKQLDMLRGQPVSIAIGKLGYPANEGNIAGEKYYIWSTSATSYFTSATTSTGRGMAGGEPFIYNQTSGAPLALNLSCAIRIFVNKDEIITHTDWTGNNGGTELNGDKVGCTQYASKLEQATLPILAAKFPQANEKAMVVIRECMNKRLSGELKTYVESVNCSNPKILAAYRELNYPYMDIIELLAAKRMELARKQDANEITEEQAKVFFHEFFAQMIDKERERDKGNSKL